MSLLPSKRSFSIGFGLLATGAGCSLGALIVGFGAELCTGVVFVLGRSTGFDELADDAGYRDCTGS